MAKGQRVHKPAAVCVASAAVPNPSLRPHDLTGVLYLLFLVGILPLRLAGGWQRHVLRLPLAASPVCQRLQLVYVGQPHSELPSSDPALLPAA